MDRRKWIKRAAIGSVLLGGAGVYPFLEAKWCRLRRATVTLPNLPKPFEGTTVAFLSDVHHGPFVPRSYVRSIVEMTNALKADFVLLGGDYCHRGPRFIAPVLEELGKLKAPMGRFAVLGNHDHWDGPRESIDGLEAAGIPLLRNRGVWIEKGLARLRIGGVGDLWCDKVDVASAVGDATVDDAVLLLSHNPDVAETLTDPRVGLMLSGHTHGGQVIVPFYGAPFVALGLRPEVSPRADPRAGVQRLHQPGCRHRRASSPPVLPPRGRPAHADRSGRRVKSTMGRPKKSTSRYRTVADLLHQLGDIPPDRVRLDPPPGKATERHLIAADDRKDILCELVDGVLVEKAAGCPEALVVTEFACHLGLFIKQGRLGIVTGVNGPFRLRPGLVLSPSLSFITWARLPGRKIPRESIPTLAPDLVVEVLREANTRGEIKRKLREYFDAGVRLVWLIDPRTRTAVVHTSPKASTKLGQGQSLDGGDVLPGFALPLAELFECLDRRDD